MNTITEQRITLLVTKELPITDVAAFYRAVVEHGPNGIARTVDVDATPVTLVKEISTNGVAYTVPLNRYLTAKEVDTIVENFAASVSFNFDIECPAPADTHEVNPVVEIDREPLEALCANWAKRKHEEWVREKTEDGWAYGMAFSQSAKTHPLIRQWTELPNDYKKVDTRQVQEVLDLLRDNGYLIVKAKDMDSIFGQ